MFDEFSESSLSLELGSGIIPARLVILPIYYSEKIVDVWWFWSPGIGCVVVVWMCGGLDLVVWWFSLLGGFGYMAPGFLVWICGVCLRKFSMCGGSGVPVLDVWW